MCRSSLFCGKMKQTNTIIRQYLNRSYKTTQMQFTLFFNMQLKSGKGRGFTWMTFEKCLYYLNMFQNRCPFLYISSAFLLSFFLIFFFTSHSRIVWISFYLETLSLEPFSLFYDLVESYYTKGKW